LGGGDPWVRVDWLSSRETLPVEEPSVLVPERHNYVVNPYLFTLSRAETLPMRADLDLSTVPVSANNCLVRDQLTMFCE
jgi:hypothetical protein